MELKPGSKLGPYEIVSPGARRIGASLPGTNGNRQLAGAEQDHRTVKKRVWLAKGYGSSECMADVAGNRDSEHHPERSSEMAGQSRRSRPSAFHRRIVRTRYLIGFTPNRLVLPKPLKPRTWQRNHRERTALTLRTRGTAREFRNPGFTGNYPNDDSWSSTRSQISRMAIVIFKYSSRCVGFTRYLVACASSSLLIFFGTVFALRTTTGIPCNRFSARISSRT